MTIQESRKTTGCLNSVIACFTTLLAMGMCICMQLFWIGYIKDPDALLSNPFFVMAAFALGASAIRGRLGSMGCLIEAKVQINLGNSQQERT
jgi:ABC-type polysaccharide/polyol phosphate export permease